MSNLNTLINGFDALSGAAFGGGSRRSGRSGRSGGGGGGSARSPINSHPSAMTSAQYNHTYGNGTRDTVNCADVAVMGALAGGGKSLVSSLKNGSIPTPVGIGKDALKGGAVAGVMCIISSSK